MEADLFTVCLFVFECVCLWTHTCHGTHAEVKGEHAGLSCLSSTMRVPGMDTNQAWQQAPPPEWDH